MTAHDILERFVHTDLNDLTRLRNLQEHAKIVVMDAAHPRIIQLLEKQDGKLLAIVDDGHNKDHVRFYDWGSHTWKELCYLNGGE
jgi:histidinol phosphatase-like PHP family hydrolase